MDALKGHFRVDYRNAKSADPAIFQGRKYRITILSDFLVRLEYSENGTFEDRPTELAINRKFNVPKMEINEDASFLSIKTSQFHLEYQKEKPFIGPRLSPEINLKITLLETDKFWYFNHPEARNFGGTTFSLDNYYDISLDKSLLTRDGFLRSFESLIGKRIQKGLYSLDGFTSIDDSKSMVYLPDGMLEKRTGENLDTYVFLYKRDFGSCLKNYFELTGYPAMIPKYALGIWWNRDIPYNNDGINDVVYQFNKKQIPLSVILLGKYWHKVNTNFQFNDALIKEPESLIKDLHEQGINVGLEINPESGLSKDDMNYPEFAKRLSITENKIIPFDMFNRDYISNYFDLIIKPLNQLGTDFYFINYKEDMDNLKALNNYHLKDYNAGTEKRGMILSRNGLIASHRFPICYSGETIVNWKTLEFLPYFNSTAANIGLSYWSHDIGGFKDGIEDAELYMRYVQFGTFSPIFRFSAKEGHFYKREPWKWDVQTLSVVREYCNLRYKLIPYIYSACYKYHKTGLPLTQPLYYQYPDIKDEPEYKNEYYFGSELLVSPITEKKDPVMNRVVKRIFLPNGVWYDFKTGKKFPGGKRYVAFFKDEDYPVYAKSGSIIPIALPDETNRNIPSPVDMEIHIFPGRSNNFNLYEDDGFSSLYQNGYYITTNIDYNYQTNNFTVIIRPVDGQGGIIPAKRNYTIRFRNTKQADAVIVYIDNDKSNCYSHVEEGDFVVEVKNVPTNKQLTVNCKGKDIETDAVRYINEEIYSVLNDIQIKTELKEKIEKIMFGDEPNNRKRIAIRKLRAEGLSRLFVRLFLKLLEYVAEI